MTRNIKTNMHIKKEMKETVITFTFILMFQPNN